jgi:hypothetical protein
MRVSRCDHPDLAGVGVGAGAGAWAASSSTCSCSPFIFLIVHRKVVMGKRAPSLCGEFIAME